MIGYLSWWNLQFSGEKIDLGASRREEEPLKLENVLTDLARQTWGCPFHTREDGRKAGGSNNLLKTMWFQTLIYVIIYPTEKRQNAD